MSSVQFHSRLHIPSRIHKTLPLRTQLQIARTGIRRNRTSRGLPTLQNTLLKAQSIDRSPLEGLGLGVPLKVTDKRVSECLRHW
jgi:hypothetical protein